MQNEQIIIRNMDNIKTKRKKDIIPLIKYEINKYMPIDLQNYIIKYKNIIDFNNNECIQAILFPKKFVHICNDISQKLEIKKKYLHINFDILQKLIDMKLIDLTYVKNKEIILIENRLEDMIVNRIFNNKIIESYIVNKNDFINTCCKENTYYYGIDDEYIKKLNIKKCSIKFNKIILNKDEDLVNGINDYLSVLGLIV